MQTTKHKKPPPVFVIRLVGPGVRPWSIPARSLTRVFNAVQRLIEHTEPEDAEEPQADDSQPKVASPIQLLGVTSGSADYRFGAFDGTGALKTLEDIGRNLCRPADAEWDRASLYSIEEISAAAKAIGCTVEIRRHEKTGNVIAKITRDSYAEISESAFIKGESSVYGYLERVGGAVKPHCGLRIQTQPDKMVICRVATEDLVRELGAYVYKYVRVSGTITWLRKNWQIKSVEVRAFEPAKTGSIREALDAIYDAGGKAWDTVDDVEAVIKGGR